MTVAFTDPFPFDGSTWPPNYVEIFKWRQRRLLMMRAEPILLYGALEYYRTHHAEFIEHWMTTYDPRNAGRPGMLTYMPFALFKRQRELIAWLRSLLTLQIDGLAEKCRDVGATWLCAAFSVHLWRFYDGAAIGWGSRKQELVDSLGDPDSIFEKMRILIRNLPPEFWPKGFDPALHMPFERIVNPETGATITGEVGDNIGRGGRKLIYFKDESAHYERPEKIEAALSQNTRVQVDISSVNGIGNVFYRKRQSGEEFTSLGIPLGKKRSVFIFDVFDHPAKNRAWYDEQRTKFEEAGLGHIFAQEIDRDYAASVTGVIIKAQWVKAAIDAHKLLGFDDEGPCISGLDVADDTPNGDLNAQTVRKGPIVKFCVAWGGLDTGQTANRAIQNVTPFVQKYGRVEIDYDAIGLGAGVKSEVNRQKREGLSPKGIEWIAWVASASPLFKDRKIIMDDPGIQVPTNGDYFANLKAQGWWQVARRFERTWRCVQARKLLYDPGELVSIPSDLDGRHQLEAELSQATSSLSTSTMKVVVNKTPDGTRSPNRADSFIEAYWPANAGAVSYDMKMLGV